VRSLLTNPILTGRVRFNARRMQLDRRTGRRVPRTPRLVRGAAVFTGLVFCECGSRLTRKKSERKGHTYNYWSCSRQLRYEDCPHNAKVREDALMSIIRGCHLPVCRSRWTPTSVAFRNGWPS
jgi:hypothetical protein